MRRLLLFSSKLLKGQTLLATPSGVRSAKSVATAEHTPPNLAYTRDARLGVIGVGSAGWVWRSAVGFAVQAQSSSSTSIQELPINCQDCPVRDVRVNSSVHSEELLLTTALEGLPSLEGEFGRLNR